MNITPISYFDPELNKTRVSVWEASDVLSPSRNRSKRTLKKLIAKHRKHWLARSTYKKVHMDFWVQVTNNSLVLAPNVYLTIVDGRYFYYSCSSWPNLENKWFTREEVYGDDSKSSDKID